MTKAQELQTLEKIAALIQSAGEDSYIGLTFAGVVDLCRRNIEDDFGNAPVRDLEEAREQAAAARQHGQALADELDRLQEDFRTLEAAYRDAVNASEAARPFAIEAMREAEEDLRSLPDDAQDYEIVAAYRRKKIADKAVRMTAEVQSAAYSKPLVYSYKPDQVA